MRTSDEVFESITNLLAKYKKNVEQVPAADLAGKYKVPFNALKQQLADELSEFVKVYALEPLTINPGSFGTAQFIEDVNKAFTDSDIGPRISAAAYKDIDLKKIRKLCQEFRGTVYERAYVPYFNRNTCLRVAEENLKDIHNIPRVYNSLVDKVFDEKTRQWIDLAATGPVILIYVQEGNEDGN